jgi:hypothetical protein
MPCRAGLVANGDSAQPAPVAFALGYKPRLRAVMRGGSGRRGAALVPDDGDRLPLGEPGASGERPIELAVAQPLVGPGLCRARTRAGV